MTHADDSMKFDSWSTTSCQHSTELINVFQRCRIQIVSDDMSATNIYLF